MEIKNKFEDMQLLKKKLLGYLLQTMKKFTKNSVEKCWAIIDVEKIGYVKLEDFRKGLLKMSIHITKTELAFAFNFLDQNKSGILNFYELLDFWQFTPTIFDKLKILFL